MITEEVRLKPNDLVTNYAELLSWAGILALGDDDAHSEIVEDDIKELEASGRIQQLIRAFTINSSEGGEPLEVSVGPGKFKSAILLHYLSFIHHNGGSKFGLSEQDKVFIRDYFPEDYVTDALEKPDTKHTTIRALLSGGVVTVAVAP